MTPSQVVVWGGVPAAFTVTNHATPTAPGAGTGSFSVTQLVYPAAAVAGGSFGLQYGCSNGDGWIIGYIELEYLKTATVRNLPTGTVCEIFQISEPPPKAGWEYTKRDVSPDPFVIGDRDTIYVGAKVYAEWVG